MTIMYDSVNINNLPTNAKAVAYYVDGLYKEDPNAIRARCPDASLLPISVEAGTFYDLPVVFYDVENGNAPFSTVLVTIRMRSQRNLTGGVYWNLETANSHSNQIVFTDPARWPAVGVYEWVAEWTGVLAPPVAGAVAEQEQALNVYDVSDTVGSFPSTTSVAPAAPVVTSPVVTPVVTTVPGGIKNMQIVNTQVVIKDRQGWCPNPVPEDAIVSVMLYDMAPAVVGGYDNIPMYGGLATDANSPNGILVFSGGADGTYGVRVVSGS